MVYLDEALMMDVDVFYAMDLLLRKAKDCSRRPFGGAAVSNIVGLCQFYLMGSLDPYGG